MPHARAVHRDQGHAVLGADGLHLRVLTGRHRADVRPAHLRRLRGIDHQRDAVLPHRQQAARVQHLRARGRDLLSLVVRERAQLTRGRCRTRVGAEHAGHIGPDLEFTGGEQRGEVGPGGVRAAAAEQHRIARRVAGDETLGDHDRAERRDPGLHRGVGSELAGGREEARLDGGAVASLGSQHRASVQPRGGHALRAEIGRAQCGREQFARGHHRSTVARIRCAPCGDLRDARRQRLELRIQGRRSIEPQLGCQLEMPLAQGREFRRMRTGDGR